MKPQTKMPSVSAKKKHACSKCDYSSDNKSNLNAHVNIHNRNMFKCPDCSAVLIKRNYVIKRHQETSCKNLRQKQAKLELDESAASGSLAPTIGMQSTTIYLDVICDRITEVRKSGKPDMKYIKKKPKKNESAKK